MTDNGDFNALVDSYIPAAAVMGDERLHVENAVALAMRFLRRCPSCRHSRAPLNVIEVAQEDGRLEIYRRSCSEGHLVGLNGCPYWEQLEIPIELEVM